MSTILNDDELPPLRPRDHPEPHTMQWSQAEMRAIRAYARAAINAHDAKLAQQEPVAWLIDYKDTGEREVRFVAGSRGDKQTPLYTHPAPQQAERHALQNQGKHPAPCARFCESKAYEIEIRQLKSQLEQADRQRVPQDREEWLAVREGHFNAAADEYFNARPILDTAANRRIFYAGHCKGYDAAAPEAPAQEGGAS